LPWWPVDQTGIHLPAVSQLPATTAQDVRRVLDQLRARLDGCVIPPDDPGYDRAA
jgi:hypothetical protein